MEGIDKKEFNKLLAEFLGYKFAHYDTYKDDGDEMNYSWTPYQVPVMYKDESELVDCLETDIHNKWRYKKYHRGYNNKFNYNFDFHKNWDQLIEIVERLEEMDLGVKMCRKVVEIYIDSTKETIISVKESNRLDSLYKALYEFFTNYIGKKILNLLSELDESNRIIANFTDRVKHTNFHDGRGLVWAFYDHNGSAIEMHKLKFHESYEWLMPIVEKIESLGISITIKNNFITVSGSYKDESYSWVGGSTNNSKILSIWYGVVEFIKWYNKK